MAASIFDAAICFVGRSVSRSRFDEKSVSRYAFFNTSPLAKTITIKGDTA